MGGVGKSVLAALVARDYTVRRTFRDGIVWVKLGHHPNLLDELRKVGAALGTDLSDCTSVTMARMRLSLILEGKECLLILDDLWSGSDAEPFIRALNATSRLMVTTRNLAVGTAMGARPYQLGLLNDNEARELLAKWSGQPVGSWPPEADEVVALCGNLPLALSMIGAMVGSDPGRWENVVKKLKGADLEKIHQQFPDYDYPNLMSSIDVSVDALERDSDRYLDLAVFSRAAQLPEEAIEALWTPLGLTKYDSQDLIDRFVNLSLAQRDDNRRITLHDLQQYYIRKRSEPNLAALHERLLTGYRARCPGGWHTGPHDHYFFEHLAYHLVNAGHLADLQTLLEEGHWYRVKRDADPSLASFLDDIQTAVEPAEKASPPDFPAISALSLIAAHAKEQVSGIPLEALSALARLGEWRKALAYVPSIEPPERRLLALCSVAEIVRDNHDDEALRATVAEGLHLAEKLDPSLRQAEAVELSLDEALAQLQQKCASDETTTVLDLRSLYFPESNELEEYKGSLAKLGVLDARFVLLGPRLADERFYEVLRVFHEMAPDNLAQAEFPRADDPKPKDFELSALSMAKWLPTSGTEKINTDLVRGAAAELRALIDQSERALSMASQVRWPMNRFPAMAMAAQAFARQGRLEPIQRIWAILKDLDSDKYVGGAPERCDIMLRMVSAFLPFGDEKQTKAPMGAALSLATDLRSLLAAAKGTRDRQKLIEDLLDDKTNPRALSMLQARAQLQEAFLKYWKDVGAASAEADHIRRDIEAATPESWHMEPEPFQTEQARAFCVLGTVMFRVGEVEAAEKAWSRAVELAEKTNDKRRSARLLATAADALAGVGWRAPAEAFSLLFLSLMATAHDSSKEREGVLRRWSAVCVEAGHIEDGLGLAERATEPASRLDAQASAAVALANAGDGNRAKTLIQSIVTSARATAGTARAASAMAKAVAACCVLEDTAAADDLQKEALSLALGAEREPECLDALIAFIDSLNMAGHGDRAGNIIQTFDDVARRGVMLASLIRSVAADTANLATSDFVNLASWGLSVAVTDMNKEEYHYPLALLLLSEALRLSGKAQEVAKLGAFEGDLVQAAANMAFAGMNTLIGRDGDVGYLRCLSVFRVAARLIRFAPNLTKEQQFLGLWENAREQHRIEEFAISTSGEFVEALRRARAESVAAVWSRLAVSGPLLASANAAMASWMRIDAAERGRLQLHQDDAGTSGSMADLLARGKKEFAEIAKGTAENQYRERLAELDRSTGSPTKDDLVKAVRAKHEAGVLRLLEHGVDINGVGSDGQAPLHHAVALGLESMVQLLLGKGADPNRTDKEGKSLLFIQTSARAAAIMKLLIEAGAQVNQESSGGDTPLSEAILFNRLEIVKVLLEHGANPNLVREKTPPLIFSAISDNHAEIVELLLKHGANGSQPALEGLTPLMFAAGGSSEAVIRALVKAGASIEGKGIAGATPLMAAVNRGDETILRVVLELGAFINAEKDDGVTALILAASNGSVPIVQSLLDHGADIEKVNVRGHSALGVAAAAGHESVVRLLLERGANPNRAQDKSGATTLMLAAAAGHVGVMVALIEHGVVVDQTTPAGWTALMSSARKNQPEAVLWLADHGALIDRATEDGSTALAYAAESGHEAVVELLIKRGIDVDHRNAFGATALLRAAGEGRDAVVKLLIDAGANVDGGDQEGTTALSVAAGNGHATVVRMLLAQGASVNLASVDGTTPLMAAAGGGQNEIVEILLTHGADIRQTTMEGGTALMFPAQNGHLSTVKLLIEKGADPHHAMNDGRTALDFALQNEHLEIAQFLRRGLRRRRTFPS